MPDSSGSERVWTVHEHKPSGRLYDGSSFTRDAKEKWCFEVVERSRLQEAERQLAEARKALSDIGWSARWHLPWDPEERLKRISEKTSTALSALRSGETAG